MNLPRRSEMLRKSVILLLGLTLGAGATAAAPKPSIYQRDKLTLMLLPLTASTIDNPGASKGSSPTVKIPIRPEDGLGSGRFAVAWPTAESRTEVRIQARLESFDASRETRRSAGPVTVLLEATLDFQGGRRVRAERRVAVREGSTSLFEMYRIGDAHLTVAVDGYWVSETVFSGRPTVIDGLELHLEIQRLRKGQPVSLETNRLSTFVGEPVSYFFTLSPQEELRIQLTPVRISGSVIEVDVRLVGTLPGKDGPRKVDRRERLFSTRGASSTVAVETGDPPEGYRFVIRPRF